MNEVEKIAVKVAHVVEYPFTETAKIVKVLDTVITEQPEIKTVITALVSKCNAIGADVFLAVGQKGLNIAEDMTIAQEIEALGSYLKSTVFPVIEKVYGEIKEDVTAPVPATAS